MMRRVAIIGAVLLALAAAAVLFTAIPGWRLKANFDRSRNNLRELSLFAAHSANPNAYVDPHPGAKRDLSRFPTQVPAGTVFLPEVPPDSRLSWVVGVLPCLDQRQQNTMELLARIDQTKPWIADASQQAAATRVLALLCPQNTPEVPAGSPAVTCYVGIGGVGADPASLPAGSPKAGAFRYDGPTPFDRITDGISQSLLFAETRNEVGPWLRGGPSTVRGLNDAPGAPPLVGGQFGGYFPQGGNFAFCDGSARVFTPQTSPQVLLSFATIAGKEADPIPGE
jgi:prepilin-type processing-associated H-X9-DG protein